MSWKDFRPARPRPHPRNARYRSKCVRCDPVNTSRLIRGFRETRWRSGQSTSSRLRSGETKLRSREQAGMQSPTTAPASRGSCDFERTPRQSSSLAMSASSVRCVSTPHRMILEFDALRRSWRPSQLISVCQREPPGLGSPRSHIRRAEPKGRLEPGPSDRRKLPPTRVFGRRPAEPGHPMEQRACGNRTANNENAARG
jgi:hypothetical protein